MKIGLDFDNTIVSYDDLSYQVAFEQGFIQENIPRNKVSVRDHLRSKGLEQNWIELQGLIYGPRMKDASIFEGFIEFIIEAKKRQHEIFIISHKTRYPFVGLKYDLHAAAREWIEKNLFYENDQLISEKNIYFEVSKADKITRIKDLGCNIYIDDLPEILKDLEIFPSISRVLFDPERHHSNLKCAAHLERWDIAWDLLDALNL
ncbi:MAG: haloacid dehalogenase-like hydrolase [Alphaproteobacteria bacterium]